MTRVAGPFTSPIIVTDSATGLDVPDVGDAANKAVRVNQVAGGVPANPLLVGANVAAAANNQTLAGAVGKTTYISGFDITGLGATAGSQLKVTVTGLLGGVTLTYDYAVPAGVTVAAPSMSIRFNQPIPASALNTPIVVNVPSFGAGNTSASASAFGFQI